MTLGEKWRTRRVKWRAVAVFGVVMVIVAMLAYSRQSMDRRTLEEKQTLLRDAQLVLQKQRDEKLRDLSLADTAEYIEERARESGYLLPGEIRFEITNLDELLAGGTEAQTEIVEEGS